MPPSRPMQQKPYADGSRPPRPAAFFLSFVGAASGSRLRLPRIRFALPCTLLCVMGSCSCRREPNASSTTQGPDPAGALTVYCSVDEAFARPALAEFEAESGRSIAAIFDSEAGKTTGLVQRIIQEHAAGRVRADVFWSSEVFNTIRLARLNLLEPYDPPTAADIPARFRDPQHRWTGTAVRARVLAFSTARTSSNELPTHWEQLAEPRFAQRVAFANPLFGTTRGHVAAMFVSWGPERARDFLTRLRDGGAMIADGNSATVRALLSARVSLACTDTDDVWLAQRQDASLDLRYLDMGGGGTLLVPCTVAILKDVSHPREARRLVDFLVSPAVERHLAQTSSRNVPVRESLRKELGASWPPETAYDLEDVADAMDDAEAAVREILLR